MLVNRPERCYLSTELDESMIEGMKYRIDSALPKHIPRITRLSKEKPFRIVTLFDWSPSFLIP